MTLRHAVGFAVREEGSQTQASLVFRKAVTTLIGRHLISRLTADMEVQISQRMIKEPPLVALMETAEQIRMMLNKDAESPNFVWNRKLRGEMREVLKQQLAATLSTSVATAGNFVSRFLAFAYSANKDEIIVDSIFVRGLNRDPSVPLDNPGRFFVAAVQFLGSGESDMGKIAAVTEAIYNVASRQKAVEAAGVTPDTVDTLQKLLASPAVVSGKFADKMQTLLLGLFSEIAKCAKTAPVIMQNDGFARLVLGNMCKYRENTVTSRWALECAGTLLRHEECEELAVRDGYATILLSICFDSAAQKTQRIPALESMGTLLNHDKLETHTKVLTCFVPQQLLEQVVPQATKRAAEVMESIDAENYDAYLVWSAELKQKVTAGLAAEVEKIAQSVVAAQRTAWVEVEKGASIDQEVNRNEIIVGDVVLSSFIKCPMLRLKVSVAKALPHRE